MLNLCCFRSAETDAIYSKTDEYQPITSTDLKLVQLQILFRHGARTPINFIKGVPEATYHESLNDDLPETLFKYEVVRYGDLQPAVESALEADLKNIRLKGGCYASMLTTVGQKQMYELGQKIRDAYLNELDLQEFSQETVRLRTTQLTRTIKSLRCVLAGIFGNDNLKKVGSVNFVVKPILDEDLFPNKLTCPTLRLATDIALARLCSLPTYRRDKSVVLHALRLPMTDSIDFASVRDDIVCRKAHGLKIPQELVPHLDMIEENAARTLYAAYSGKTGHSREKGMKDTYINVTKLAIGRLVHTILSQMEKFSNRKCFAKLYLYSAHDTSLTPMMEALGIWDFVWPPFASNIIFELYERKRDSRFFVRVLYCGQAKTLRESRSALIPLTDFRLYLQKYRLPHYLYSKACLIHYVN